MRIQSFDYLPDEARTIREDSFIVEKGYRPEFDEWDDKSTHLLMFDGTRPVATCRFYPDPDHPEQRGRFVIARLAVVADMRGHRLGSMLLADAEHRISAAGGIIAAVHSEDNNYSFYERHGYALTADVYDNGAHGWMTKSLNARNS
jgi:predicted GNAT family N-acyltransferase